MQLIFATNNLHKLEEVQSLLKNHPIKSLKDIKCIEEIPETSDTIEGNALQKARYVNQKYHVDCFADDTGLEVESLGGKPGVYSARYAGEHKSSEDNIQKILTELNGIQNRKAQFKTVIALIVNEREFLFEGITSGNIIESPKGLNGFGYDSIFVPDGFNKSYAEMAFEEKNRYSHRAMAVKKLNQFLSNF